MVLTPPTLRDLPLTLWWSEGAHPAPHRGWHLVLEDTVPPLPIIHLLCIWWWGRRSDLGSHVLSGVCVCVCMWVSY